MPKAEAAEAIKQQLELYGVAELVIA